MRSCKNCVNFKITCTVACQEENLNGAGCLEFDHIENYKIAPKNIRFKNISVDVKSELVYLKVKFNRRIIRLITNMLLDGYYEEFSFDYAVKSIYTNI